MDEEMPYCNYYGNLQQPLKGRNVGYFIMDESYRRMLQQHEQELQAKQNKLVLDFKKSLNIELKKLKVMLSKVNNRMTEIEKILSKNEEEHKEKKKPMKKKKDMDNE